MGKSGGMNERGANGVIATGAAGGRVLLANNVEKSTWGLALVLDAVEVAEFTEWKELILGTEGAAAPLVPEGARGAKSGLLVAGCTCGGGAIMGVGKGSRKKLTPNGI
jgi:hypothetical protein